MLTYTIWGQLVTIGRSYNVVNENGERLFKIAGRVGFARRFSVKGRNGARLYSVREKLLCIEPTFIISRDGLESAIVRRTTANDISDMRFKVELKSGDAIDAFGTLWDDEGVKISHASGVLGRIRREKNIVLREKFIAETDPNADQGLLLAIAMSIVETTWHRGGD